MKNVTLAGLLVALLAAAVMAQSPFDGTWKINLGAVPLPTKPTVWLLQDGIYHCKSCVPAIEVKADGRDQHVTGQRTTLSVSGLSMTVLSRKLKRKTARPSALRSSRFPLTAARLRTTIQGEATPTPCQS